MSTRARMNANMMRNELPRAYAVALWLRDLSFDCDQIAEVLSIAPEAVLSLLEVAGSKLRRLREESRSGACHDPGVGVVVDADAATVAYAVAVCRRSGAPLHVLASYKTCRPSAFRASNRITRACVDASRAADAALLAAARRALQLGATVVPHAIAADVKHAVALLVEGWGPVTFVLSDQDTALANQIRKAGGTAVILGRAGQAMNGAARAPRPRFRLRTEGGNG